MSGRTLADWGRDCVNASVVVRPTITGRWHVLTADGVVASRESEASAIAAARDAYAYEQAIEPHMERRILVECGDAPGTFDTVPHA